MSRVRILSPLRERNFALYLIAATASMIGDGAAIVAIAWQAYDLSNTPAALSMVLLAWTASQVPVFLVGGVLSDRVDRRRLMISADAMRAVLFVVLAVLVLTDALTIPLFVLLAVFFGAADALFAPAASAIIPDIVPDGERRVQANSLVGFVRPIAFRMLGPSLGGVLVASVGAGGTFFLTALTFTVSGLALLMMSWSPTTSETSPDVSDTESQDSPIRSMLKDLREAFAYVIAEQWLWRTLAVAAIVLLFYWGPLEVLVPYIVKNSIGSGAQSLGIIFAAGGVGSMLASLAVGHFGLPARQLVFLYTNWALGCLAFASFAFADTIVFASAVAFVSAAFMSAGWITWSVVLQGRVPTGMLGRVSSLDWLLSTALIPLSFALVGPVNDAIGTSATFLWAGIIGAVTTFALMAAPTIVRPAPPTDDPDSTEHDDTAAPAATTAG